MDDRILTFHRWMKERHVMLCKCHLRGKLEFDCRRRQIFILVTGTSHAQDSYSSRADQTHIVILCAPASYRL